MFGINDILLAILVIATTIVSCRHWRQLRDWLIDLTETVFDLGATISHATWYAVRIFAEVTCDGVIKIVHKFRYVKDKRMKERVTNYTTEISVSDLPADAQALLRRGGVEITDEMERVLEMKLS